MNWSIVAIVAAIGIGCVGLGLMAAAFVLVARQGGWRQAMWPQPDGRRSLPRRLMVAGASLGIVYAAAVMLLFVLPGGIPWIEGWGWAYIAGVLPPLVAVWYFILRPAFALRRHQSAGHHSAQSNAGSER
jgi:hypothetical protein